MLKFFEEPLAHALHAFQQIRVLALGAHQTKLLAFLHKEAAQQRRVGQPLPAQPSKLPLKKTAIRKLWESRQLQLERAVPDDWLDWLRHLSA